MPYFTVDATVRVRPSFDLLIEPKKASARPCNCCITRSPGSRHFVVPSVAPLGIGLLAESVWTWDGGIRVTPLIGSLKTQQGRLLEP